MRKNFAAHYPERPIGWSDGDVLIAGEFPYTNKKSADISLNADGPSPEWCHFRRLGVVHVSGPVSSVVIANCANKNKAPFATFLAGCEVALQNRVKPFNGF